MEERVGKMLEDDLLIKLVGKQPTKNWAEIALQLPGRMGKQCRERWNNHLKPEINKDPWTKEEETILINAHSEYGNKWSEIAKILPGRLSNLIRCICLDCARTENSVKNHWNCSLKKKLGNFSANGSAVNEKVEHGNSGKANCSKIIEMPLDDRDFFISCSIKPRRHSDTYDNFRMQQSSSDWNYTGLCYEPIQKSDMNIFLSTGKFPSTDSYIRQPNRSVSVTPPCRSYTKESSDIYGSSPKSMLNIAAMSYKVPSIIRKRAVRTLENGLSAKDKVIRSLNGMIAMYKDPKVDDDQVENKGELVLSSPKHQKLDKSAAIKSVGKCLERTFSDAFGQ
ncbi:hypothetical protein DH2020_002220 [Rehmannia glutinosa]|uniref:R2R3-MYB protein n=1 Tax=Rehmannia glutinosa TaxID=99300 RepID=A0ABR0XT65_REHGL